MKGFAQGLALKQRRKATRKSPNNFKNEPVRLRLVTGCGTFVCCVQNKIYSNLLVCICSVRCTENFDQKKNNNGQEKTLSSTEHTFQEKKMAMVNLISTKLSMTSFLEIRQLALCTTAHVHGLAGLVSRALHLWWGGSWVEIRHLVFGSPWFSRRGMLAVSGKFESV